MFSVNYSDFCLFSEILFSVVTDIDAVNRAYAGFHLKYSSK